jgi:hypothetical protein
MDAVDSHGASVSRLSEKREETKKPLPFFESGPCDWLRLFRAPFRYRLVHSGDFSLPVFILLFNEDIGNQLVQLLGFVVLREITGFLVEQLSPFLTAAENARFAKLRAKLRKATLNFREMIELERLAELKSHRRIILTHPP